MVSPYGIQPINSNKRTKKALNTNIDNNSHHERELKRPQKTSNDLKRYQPTSNINVKSLKSKNKNNLKGGSTHEKIEINEYCLDEILHNNNS